MQKKKYTLDINQEFKSCHITYTRARVHAHARMFLWHDKEAAPRFTRVGARAVAGVRAVDGVRAVVGLSRFTRTLAGSLLRLRRANAFIRLRYSHLKVRRLRRGLP